MTSGECLKNKWFYMKYIYREISWCGKRPVNVHDVDHSQISSFIGIVNDDMKDL